MHITPPPPNLVPSPCARLAQSSPPASSGSSGPAERREAAEQGPGGDRLADGATRWNARPGGGRTAAPAAAGQQGAPWLRNWGSFKMLPGESSAKSLLLGNRTNEVLQSKPDILPQAVSPALTLIKFQFVYFILLMHHLAHMCCSQSE